MSGITYDAAVLIAAESGSETVWALHRSAVSRNVRPVVPSVVLAQAWRGGPQHLLSRLLRGCTIDSVAEGDARAAGAAMAASATRDVVDAVVVVAAIRRGDTVVTGDPDDLTRIADALGKTLFVRSL